MLATMGEAHREWHLNAGVPMGTPGCPQDACHPIDDDYEEECNNTLVVTCGVCKGRTTVDHVREHFAAKYAGRL